MPRSGGKQAGAHAGGHPNAGGRHVAAKEFHRVDDSQSGGNAAAGRVDVKLNIAFGIIVGKKQELRNDGNS